MVLKCHGGRQFGKLGDDGIPLEMGRAKGEILGKKGLTLSLLNEVYM